MLPEMKNPSRDFKSTRHPHHPPQSQQQSGQYLWDRVSKFDERVGVEVARTVQITLAGLCNAAATLLLVLLEDVDLLESLHDLPVDAAAAVNVVRRAGATVLGDTVNLPQTANTDSLPEVDMAGN